MDDQDPHFDPEIDGTHTGTGCLIVIIASLATANLFVMLYKWG